MARIKGTSLIKMLKVLQKNPAVAERVIPPELQHYFEDRVLSSAWYPEEHYKILLLALGGVLKPLVKNSDVWEFIGVEGAQQDFTGIYASAVRKGDPWGGLERIGSVWSMFRDTGRIELVRDSESAARVLIHDYPMVCPEICGTITGYLHRFVELCGAHEISVQLVRMQNPKLGPTDWLVRFAAP
jgi:hypothetical protein